MASALRSPSFDPPARSAAQPRYATTTDHRSRQTSVTVIVSPEPEHDRRLQRLKHASSIACSVLLAAAGLAYGDQVYVNHQTETARNQITSLQEEAQQLSVSIEALKYQAAQLGDAKDTDLILQTPEQFIFVEPSLSRPPRPASPTTAVTSPPQFPIGY